MSWNHDHFIRKPPAANAPQQAIAERPASRAQMRN